MVPTVRLTLRTGRSSCTRSPEDSAPSQSWISVLSSALSSPWSWARSRCRGVPGGQLGHREDRREVEALGLPVPHRLARVEHLGVPDGLVEASGSPAPRGTRAPPAAMNRMKLTTYSGRPSNRLRSSGFCVATPTGQVSRWQTRIMMQPDTTSGAVAKPNSSAPSSAAMTTSRPVLSWPSVCTTIRSRSPLASSVCWVSARPSSHGAAGVLDRRQRRRAGAAVVPGDQHDVGVRLGHARRDRADADLGDQLDVHAGPRVGVLQVVDELLDVLDGVDVVVRRRGDQADARRGVPGLGDPRVHLARRAAGRPRRAWRPARS